MNILTLGGARNLTLARFGDPQKVASVYSTFDLGDSASLSARVTELQNQVFSAMKSPEGKQLIDELNVKRKPYVEHRDAALKLAKEGRNEDMAKLAETSLQPAYKSYLSTTHKLLDYTRKQIAQEQAVMEAEVERARTLLMVFVVLGLASAVVIAWRLTRSITEPLRTAVAVAGKVASGDLTTRIEAAVRTKPAHCWPRFRACRTT